MASALHKAKITQRRTNEELTYTRVTHHRRPRSSEAREAVLGAVEQQARRLMS